MIVKTYLIVLLNLYALHAFAQNPSQASLDSAVFKTIDTRYKGGYKAFFTVLGETLRCPKEAVENCRWGIVLVRLKIRPSGVIDSVIFKNDIPLGMGIEEEIAAVLLTTKGKWTRAVEYETIDFSIAFHEDEDKPQATMLVTISKYGAIADCPSNDELIKHLERAKKKAQYKKAILLCEDLIRRFPHSEDYKKELVFLKSK
jgi:hypothetical protein